MTIASWSRFALPLALLGFVVVASVYWRHLPGEVPVHFDESGRPDRWMEPRPFIALQIGLAGGLAGMLTLARWVLANPGYDADGLYRRSPHLRARLQALIDLLGAGGILLITWTGYLCARAAHDPSREVPRAALMLPLAVLVGAIVAGFVWQRADRRRAP